MLRIAAAITVVALALRLRLETAGERVRSNGPDAGLGTLEIVVISLGLFLIAGIAVAILTGAVQTRLGQIN